MATTAAEKRPEDTAAWRAVLARDASLDGTFVFAVATTGVYCRPSCAARRPLRRNVSFFATSAAARAAGFRACKRCDPDHGPAADRAIVDRVRRLIDAATDAAPTLAALSQHVGVSSTRLQRLFAKVTGMTPKEYAGSVRVNRLRARLRAGDSVSRAGIEAGYGSTSRVHEAAEAALGMSPSAFQRHGAGLEIRYAIVDSPLGRMLVGLTERGVCATAFGDDDRDLVSALASDFKNAHVVKAPIADHEWVRAVMAHVRGVDAPDVPIDVAGTVLQRRVWEALRRIPRGTTVSYATLAERVGSPKAVRAVASACGANRVAVVIPCHRVVRGTGALGGYRWGLDRKSQLLERERRELQAQTFVRRALSHD